MRAAVNDFALLFAQLLAALLWVGVAAADESAAPRQAGAEQWVPSIAVISGITIQSWNGAVNSQVCEGCTTPTNLRMPVTGSDNDVTPFVGGQLEVMTPELSLPLSPRFFVGADFSASFGTERSAAGQGDPSTLESPLPPGGGATPYSQNTVLGQGSQTRAELDTFLVTARAGVAFPLELFGRAMRIKPSVGWIRYEVKVNGLVVSADCATFLTSTNCNPAGGGTTREIRLSDSTNESFDGIGPGLDIEMDTGRIGPLGTSLSIGASAYKILGNRNVDLTTSTSYPDTGIPGIGASTASAQFHFDVEDWAYRAFLGLRLQWLGSEER